MKTINIKNPILRKLFGILLIFWGVIALFTPFTPGSWLAFVGLELLGVGVLSHPKIKKIVERWDKKP